jgi:glycopeptide antibiotics resistance protein
MLGTGDIDDIILNVIGTLLGYALFELISSIWLQITNPLDAGFEPFS